MLDELLKRISSLPTAQRTELTNRVMSATAKMVKPPQPGPQTDGYNCEADILLFGGSPGGGKSVLGILLGLNEHFRSLIVRKSFTDLDGLLDTTVKLVGSSANLTRGTRPKYHKPDGGVIHFVGLSDDGGIGGHQGVDHDLIYIDEAAQIPERQVRLLMGWLRSDRPGQRKRVVLGSNPPLDSTGDWLIEFFGPWLNSTHPNPAKPGELRWFLANPDGGKDIECEKGETALIAGIEVFAHSRTFIPSKFTDNKYYDASEYAKTLAALPEAEREILVTGNFMMARRDQPSQVIPTAWIRAAQLRWTDRPPANVPMCAMGVDPSGGGEDPLAIATRYDAWFAPIEIVEGKELPKDRIGAAQAGHVVSHRRHDAKVIVDMGGGYGGTIFETLVENIGREAVVAYKGAEAATRRTKDKKLGFWNLRSQTYWEFREALDPSQEGGSPVALPQDPEMVADLTALTFEITPRGIKVESKDHVCDRLNRSTNKGDAVVQCWSQGQKHVIRVDVNSAEQGRYTRSTGKRPLVVDHGPRRPHGMNRR